MYKTLTGRFVILIIIFVMLAEVLIFAPSVARFRESFLVERLERAQIASLTLLATPDGMVDDQLQNELLTNAGVINITLQRDNMRELVLSDSMPAMVDQNYDLREQTYYSLIRDAFMVLLNPQDRLIRVVGTPANGGGVVIEATLKEKVLRQEMLQYGGALFGCH